MIVTCLHSALNLVVDGVQEPCESCRNTVEHMSEDDQQLVKEGHCDGAIHHEFETRVVLINAHYGVIFGNLKGSKFKCLVTPP